MGAGLTALKYATGAVCAYEAWAIFGNRHPTVSVLCGRHRVMVPVILGGLAFHLLYERKP